MSCNNCNITPCNCTPVAEIPCLTCDCNPGYCDEGCQISPKSNCVIIDTPIECLNITEGNTLNEALIKIKDQICIVQSVEDKLVKISPDDTTSGFLQNKIIAGSTSTIIKSNISGNELLTLSSKISVLSQNILTDKTGLYIGSADSSTVSFSIIDTGANKKFKADVLISGDDGNRLTIGNNGLYVATNVETVLTAVDSSTIDFTTSGINSHTITGSIKLKAGANALVDDGGLFVQGKSVSNGLNEVTPNVFKLGGALTNNTILTGAYKLSMPQGKFEVINNGIEGAALVVQQINPTILAAYIVGTSVFERDFTTYGVVRTALEALSHFGGSGVTEIKSSRTTANSNILFLSASGNNVMIPTSVIGGYTSSILKAGTGNFTGNVISGYNATSSWKGVGNIEHLSGFRSLSPRQYQPNTDLGETLDPYLGAITNYYGLYLDDVYTSDIINNITYKFGIYQKGGLNLNYLEGPIEAGISAKYWKAPVRATGDRPASPTNGMFGYNSTTNKFEGYANGWFDLH